MTSTLTPHQKLAVLRHLAGGKTADVTAAIMHTDKNTVIALAKNHGYPDTDKMAWAADIMAKNLDDAVRGSLPEGMSDRAAQAAAVDDTHASVSTPRPVATPTAAATPITKPDEIRVLLNTAKAHPAKRIQNAANKVFDDLDRLRGLIREDEERNAEKRRIAAEKAAAKAEVERLEAQLRAAKAKLRGTKPPAATPASKPAVEHGPGEHACGNDGCDRTFDTKQGRVMHERLRCPHRPAAAS